MKVHTKLGIGILLLIIWTSLISIFGIAGNRMFHIETNVEELVNTCLINAQDIQVNVFRYLKYNDSEYIEEAYRDIDQTLALLERADEQLQNLSNKKQTQNITESFKKNKKLCSEILENENELRRVIYLYDASSHELIKKIQMLIVNTEQHVKNLMVIEQDHDDAISILYALKEIKMMGDGLSRFHRSPLPGWTGIENANLSNIDALLAELSEKTAFFSENVSDENINTYTENLKREMTNYKTFFELYKSSVSKEQALLNLLEEETKGSIASVRQLQAGVNTYTLEKIILNRFYIIVFAILSVIIGLLVSVILIRDIKRTLGAEPFEIREITKKVASREFDIHYPNKKPTGVLAFIKDMAEDLQTTSASLTDLEKEIREKKRIENDLKDVLDSMSEGFALHEIILDDNNKPVDYRFKYVNPSFEALVGLKSEELIGKNVLEVFPETESYWIEKYGNVALTGTALKFENYSVALDRHYSVSAYSPVNGEFAVSFLDITDKINAAKALEEKNEYLSITLKSIGDGVISTDAEGHITFLNPVTESLTEWSNQEAFGKPLEDVFHIVNEFSNERCENPAERVLKTGQVIELANHTTLISKNRKRYIIEDSAAPIIDHKGSVQGVIIVFRDTTEKAKMKDMITRNQRLESLGFLAGGIAHDFNNYLAGIFGYVELVKNRVDDDGKELESKYLKKVLDISDNAKSLTQQLLTFAKGDNTIREVISLEDIINTSMNFSLRGTNVTSTLQIQEELWNCYCDKNRISQCLDNLIINGIQSMPEGGELSISAQNTEDVPPQLPSGRYIEIKVKDTGNGIPDNLKKKIFDPFFTTKEEGHGLGLATVYSIIQNHDGIINLESSEGVGTTFTLYLPATESSIHHETDKDEKEISGSGHVLILDDQEYITEVLTDLLEGLGYSTVVAHNSQNAIVVLENDRKGPNEIRACIIDQTLPGDMSGHEVAKKMKNIDSGIILFASSGYAQSDVMQNPKDYHFEDCITKPFDMKKISKLMSRYLN